MNLPYVRVGLSAAALVFSGCLSDAESEQEVGTASGALIRDLGQGSGTAGGSLPLGKMCDGTREAFLGESLLERADCGTGTLRIPTARIESAPRYDSPYLPLRCSLPLAPSAPLPAPSACASGVRASWMETLRSRMALPFSSAMARSASEGVDRATKA